MAARVGVRREQVLDAAVAVLADRGRPDAVTLGAVASRLGIRAQSLYAHVDGSAGLRRGLALRGLDGLAAVVTEAAIGRSGAAAAEAIVSAQLDYATEHPGLFGAAIHPPGDDPDLRAAVDRVTRPLELVLTSLGFGREDRVHWIRTTLAAIYGFAMLRRDGQLTLDVDPDRSARHLVRVLVAQLELDAATGAGPPPAPTKATP